MSDSNWDLVDESKREQFEAAWISGKPVAIEECLPEVSTPAFVPTLEELVHIEMEFAWRSYQANRNDTASEESPSTVETYVERFDALATDEIVLRLVEQEMRCRKRALGIVEFDEYSSRFPNLTAGIQHLKTAIECEKTRTPDVMENMRVGEQVGRYFIADKQGEGGFGLVWQADDPKLGRTIAIKQLSGRLAKDSEHRSRFINEARIAAKLEHPGVVPVYDVEEPDKRQPYYTMKLVRGKTLEEDVQEYHASTKQSEKAKIESRRLLNVFSAICKAMQYAHDKGVIHRDLKPQNVILGDYGETIILDWGLAKFVDEVDGQSGQNSLGSPSAQVTAPGAVMGTPAYMSPEQAKGEVEKVDHRSDIYCLGVMLFHILTGKLPFEGLTGDEMISNVIAGNPIPPRRLEPGISKPLEAICLRAIRFQQEERFQSVKSLSDELDRFLADEPIDSYQESIFERTARWARKNRTWVMAGTATLVVLTVGSIVASLLINEQRKIAISNEAKAKEAKRLETIAKDDAIDARKKETQAKQAAILAADREKEQKELAQWQLSRLFIQNGLRSIEDVDYGTAALWFAQSLKVTEGSKEEKNDRVRINATLRKQQRLVDMYFCDEKAFGPLQEVRFSKDEKTALILGRKRIEIRNLETGQIVDGSNLGENSLVRFSAGGNYVIALNDKTWKNPKISVWNVRTKERIDCLLNPETEKSFYSVTHFDYSESTKQLVACIGKDATSKDASYYLAFWNLEEPDTPKFSEERQRRFASCNFSVDGKLIVTGAGDHCACVWNPETAELVHEFDHAEFHPLDRPKEQDFRVISDAKFSPDMKYLVAASSDNVAYVWDLDDQKMVHQLTHDVGAMGGEVVRVTFPKSGEVVATTDNVYSTRVWNYKTGQFIGKFDEFKGSITASSFFKDTLLLTASNDGYCKFWAPTAGLVFPVMRHASIVVAAEVDSTGNQFLTACDDQTVRFWSGNSAQLGVSRRYLPYRDKSFYDKFLFSGDGNYLVTSSRLGNESKVQIWDTATLEQIGEDIDLPNIVGMFEFSPDSRRLLLTATSQLNADAPHFAQVIDLAEGKPVGRRLLHDEWITSAGFFTDGERVFTASIDANLVVWNVADSTEAVRLKHDSAINSVCLTNNQQLLISGCRDKSVQFWSVEEGEREYDTLSLEHAVKSVVLSPDSRFLLAQAYSQKEGKAVLIDLSNGKPIGATIPHRRFQPPSFSDDAKYFSVICENEISIHRTVTGEFVSQVSHRQVILGFGWHPTKSRFASAAGDKVLRIWDIESGEPITPEMKYTGVPVQPYFSPNGNIVATGIAFGNVVRVWDSETGEPLTPDYAQQGMAEPVGFSATGEELAVGGPLLSLWSMKPYEGTPAQTRSLAELVCGHRVDKIGGLVPLTQEELKERFEEHYQKGP